MAVHSENLSIVSFAQNEADRLVLLAKEIVEHRLGDNQSLEAAYCQSRIAPSGD
jgi:hypothetical protein